MKTGPKVSLFALSLAVVFGGAWAIGAAAGPLGTQEPPAAGHGEHGGHAESPAAGAVPPGLSAAENGYRLVLDQTVLTGPADFRFRIIGSDGPITQFDVEHEKRLHLVVVRRDGSGYQHVHPQMAADGTWSVPLTLPAAGSYRVFADFKPSNGTKSTLGADVQVPGDYQPQQYAKNTVTSTVDGYEVKVSGELTTGEESVLTTTVTKDGQPVQLEPYLGANGHLVALRAADLAYLHVHPQSGAGNQVKFAVQVPTDGRYRLFLDFQHEGVVRTAEFTMEGHRHG